MSGNPRTGFLRLLIALLSIARNSATLTLYLAVGAQAPLIWGNLTMATFSDRVDGLNVCFDQLQFQMIDTEHDLHYEAASERTNKDGLLGYQRSFEVGTHGIDAKVTVLGKVFPDNDRPSDFSLVIFVGNERANGLNRLLKGSGNTELIGELIKQIRQKLQAK